MCRMLGIISVKPLTPLKHLIQADCSLLRQAELGKQGDGWGVSYYLDGSPRLFRSERPVYSERDLFRRVAASISSRIIVAHVRKASNPRGLPRDELIGVENSQPFKYHNRIFAHNGVIRAVDEAMEFLGEYRSIVKGNNDSEVYFALLMKGWDLEEDVYGALRWVEGMLLKAMRSSGKGYKNPFTSLNAIFSDGEKLYAYNRYLEGENLKSICYKDSPYYTLTFLDEGDVLVIASEKLWRDDGWVSLGNGDLLTAWIEGEEVRYDIRHVLD
ncbi:MAG: hypothetical protein B6U65_01975 [Candidatus Wolframiiraptor sp. EX4484-121]|nr:MAG: hypothetical protein B6U65_01975 [Candidatus Wolframiiraptor sp. EX4484-121]